MVAGVGNGQDSQSTSRASNLVQKNCVMSLNIIGAKARMTRTAMTGLMKGRIQARILRHPPPTPRRLVGLSFGCCLPCQGVGEKQNMTLEGCSQIFKKTRKMQDPVEFIGEKIKLGRTLTGV